MPFYSLKNVVERVLKEYKLNADVDTYKAFSLWNEIVGERMAHHAKPVRVNGHILYVEVDDPLWLTQLKYMKIDILDKIDKRIKKGVLRDVRFFLKNQY